MKKLTIALGVAGLMLGLGSAFGDDLVAVLRLGTLSTLLLFGAVLWEVKR